MTTATTKIIDYIGAGLAASRPAAPLVPTGGAALYVATDTHAISVWDGSSWTSFGNPSYISGIAAAGATQGTATALTADVNIITTVAANTGVILRSGSTNPQRIANRGVNTLNVYPNTSAQIESLAVNAAATIPAGGDADFYPDTPSQWYAL